MSKRTVQIILGFLLFVGVILVMSFSRSQRDAHVIMEIEISLNVPGEMVFVTKEDIYRLLNNSQLFYEGITYEEVDIRAIENKLYEMDQLEKIKVYMTITGQLFVEAGVREPIARVFTRNGTSFYIDKEGFVMPLSSNYTAHVLAFTGEINQPPVNSSFEIIHNDSLKNISVLGDLYAISSFIYSTPFLSNLITQVYVNSKKEYELIPRLGNFRIFLGTATDLERKFNYLEILYKEGLKNTGWDIYDSIYLKYQNQIVCRRK